MPTLNQKIEAILFYKAEPVSKTTLAKLCGVEVSALEAALLALREEYKERGIAIVDDGAAVALATAAAVASFLEGIVQEERAKELSKATSETLSTVLYMDRPTRADIDFVRGVNSSFSLRALLVRGLVDRIPHPDDARKLVYIPTIELLSHLGVTSVEALPNFAETRSQLQNELARQTEAETNV